MSANAPVPDRNTAMVAEFLLNPLRLLRRSGVIIVLCLFLTVVVYNYVYYLAGVLFESDLKERLTGHAKDQVAAIEKRKASLTAELAAIDAQLVNTASKPGLADYSVLLQRKQQLRSEIEGSKDIVLYPQFLSYTMFLWPVFYVSLALLAPNGPSSSHG